MYKLIVVDDEQLIRNGLARNIDWAGLNMQVVGCFEDGQDALDYLKDNPVDVILTDVKMYNVTGLDIAQYVQQHTPETIVVIISGFREFDFAREAMRFGVSDYLLKPLDPDEILNTFKQIEKKLDQKRENENQLEFTQLPSNQKLLDSILLGNEPEIQIALNTWEFESKACSPGQVRFATLHLIDELYSKINEVGVQLPDQFQRQAIIDGYTQGTITFPDFISSIGTFFKNKKCLDSETLVENAQKYIQEHLSTNFSVEELSDYLFISSRHLRREFHRIMGKSIVDYILQRRMEKAMELLQHTNERTAQVGKQIGYADPQYFQRVFKKYTGYSVREYRKITHE